MKAYEDNQPPWKFLVFPSEMGKKKGRNQRWGRRNHSMQKVRFTCQRLFFVIFIEQVWGDERKLKHAVYSLPRTLICTRPLLFDFQND